MASLNHLKIYLFANPDEDSANQWKFELRVDLSADFLKSWRIRWRSQYVKCRLNMAWTSQTNKTILKKTWAWTSQTNKIILKDIFSQPDFGINWSINFHHTIMSAWLSWLKILCTKQEVEGSNLIIHFFSLNSKLILKSGLRGWISNMFLMYRKYF